MTVLKEKGTHRNFIEAGHKSVRRYVPAESVELSEGAKNILKWIDGPFAEGRELLLISRGKLFSIMGSENHFVDEGLFKEVKHYLDSNGQYFGLKFTNELPEHECSLYALK